MGSNFCKRSFGIECADCLLFRQFGVFGNTPRTFITFWNNKEVCVLHLKTKFRFLLQFCQPYIILTKVPIPGKLHEGLNLLTLLVSRVCLVKELRSGSYWFGALMSPHWQEILPKNKNTVSLPLFAFKIPGDS
jgi:hypothetical protein